MSHEDEMRAVVLRRAELERDKAEIDRENAKINLEMTKFLFEKIRKLLEGTTVSTTEIRDLLKTRN